MKKLFLLSVVLLIVSTLQLSAEPISTTVAATSTSIATVNTQNNKVKGQILDLQTKETLAGAVITANGNKVYSDLDGNFELSNLCGEKCQLKISLISYQDQIVEIDANNSESLNIKLLQR